MRNNFIISGITRETRATGNGNAIVISTTDTIKRDQIRQEIIRNFDVFVRNRQMIADIDTYQHVTIEGHFEYINSYENGTVHGSLRMVADSIEPTKRLIADMIEDNDDISKINGQGYPNINVFYVAGKINYLNPTSDTVVRVGVDTEAGISGRKVSVTIGAVGRSTVRVLKRAAVGDEIMIAGEITRFSGSDEGTAENPKLFVLTGRDAYVKHVEQEEPVDNAPEEPVDKENESDIEE